MFKIKRFIPGFFLLLVVPSYAATLDLSVELEPASNLDTQKNLSGFSLESINYNGKGCPQGTAALNISNDRTAFTLDFTEFKTGLNTEKTLHSRTNCRLDIEAKIAQGWRWRIAGFLLQTEAIFDTNVKVIERIILLGGGGATNATIAEELKGELTEPRKIKFLGSPYSSCREDTSLASIVTTADLLSEGEGEGSYQIHSIGDLIFQFEKCSVEL